MRKASSRVQEVRSFTQLLLEIQKTYDAFRSKLVMYNKQYSPAHVPDLLLNTPSRLAMWCRTMQDLYLAVEDAPQVRYFPFFFILSQYCRFCCRCLFGPRC